MRTVRLFKVTLIGSVVALAVSLGPGVAAQAADATSASVYAFDLGKGDTAVSPSGGAMASPGDWITVKGSGTFDPAHQTVAAKGTFVHYAATGTVMCKGSWKATSFTSFQDFGRNYWGEEGGALSIVVTHYCSAMGMTMTDIPMTVTSTVNAPAGYVEGVTVGDFTESTSGSVTIQPEQ